MKAKNILILLCLFIAFSVFQANAQGNDNRSVQGWFQSTYWSPIFCDDVLVDYLEGGTLFCHYVVHYKNGSYNWEIDQLKGEVTSSSGEVFRVREIDKTYFTDHWYVTWHFSLLGDQGTHYIGTLTYSYYTGEVTVGKIVCN